MPLPPKLPPNLQPPHAGKLHQRIRAFLLQTMPQEHPAAIAAALMYETTSIAAATARTEADAIALVRTLIDAAEEQIEEFGVGRPHP